MLVRTLLNVGRSSRLGSFGRVGSTYPVKCRFLSGVPTKKDDKNYFAQKANGISTEVPPKPEPTAGEVINQNLGLREFISKTYRWTGGGIVGSLTLANLLAVAVPEISTNLALPMLGGGFVLAMGSCFVVDYGKYTVHSVKRMIRERSNSNPTEVEFLYSINTSIRQAGFAGIITGVSMSIAPMVAQVNELSPDILPTATLLSTLVFGGSIIAAKMCKNGSALVWQAPLFGSLMGLIGLGCINIGSLLIFGPNVVSDALSNIDAYGGVVLFSGIIAYDTHKAIERYEKRDPDHLGCAIELYLDFMNLLVRIMKILADSKRK